MRTSMIIAAVPIALMRAPSQMSGAWRDSVPDVMAAVRPALATARACGGKILKALHDSRRLQASHEMARHRHLL